MKFKILLSFASFLMATFFAGAVTDSLGIKEEDGEKFIMHRVDQGETLYAISRRYEVDVDLIKETNPQTKEQLVVGEVILVPYNPTKDQKSDAYQYHTVQKEETLFSISQQYDVSVDQVKEWNDLSSNNIEVGQELIVGEKEGGKDAQNSEKDQGDTSGPAPNEKAQESASRNAAKEVSDEKGPDKKETRKHVSEKPSASKKSEKGPKNKKAMSKYEQKYVQKEEEIAGEKQGWVTKKQEGKATWISDRNMSTRKSLALHRSAPPGTVIRVENPQNNKVVYVKTVGMLNKNKDKKTLITISQTAAEELGIQEDFFRAKLEFSVKKESN